MAEIEIEGNFQMCDCSDGAIAPCYSNFQSDIALLGCRLSLLVECPIHEGTSPWLKPPLSYPAGSRYPSGTLRERV